MSGEEKRRQAVKEAEEARERALKLARYAKLTAKLFEEAVVAINSEDYTAAAELAQTATRLTEATVATAKEVVAKLSTAAKLTCELAATEEQPAPARPQIRTPPPVIEL
jgi:Na+/phosphate symporter